MLAITVRFQQSYNISTYKNINRKCNCKHRSNRINKLPDAYKAEEIREMLEKNVAFPFALMSNVDKVTFQFDETSNDSSSNTTYEGSTIEKVVSTKLADIAESQDDLASFLNV